MSASVKVRTGVSVPDDPLLIEHFNLIIGTTISQLLFSQYWHFNCPPKETQLQMILFPIDLTEIYFRYI